MEKKEVIKTAPLYAHVKLITRRAHIEGIVIGHGDQKLHLCSTVIHYITYNSITNLTLIRLGMCDIHQWNKKWRATFECYRHRTPVLTNARMARNNRPHQIATDKDDDITRGEQAICDVVNTVNFQLRIDQSISLYVATRGHILRNLKRSRGAQQRKAKKVMAGKDHFINDIEAFWKEALQEE